MEEGHVMKEWHVNRSGKPVTPWGMGGCLPQSLYRANPANTLVSNFWAPELWENTLLLF